MAPKGEKLLGIPDNTLSRPVKCLKGSQLIASIYRCSTPNDTPASYASRFQAVCRAAHRVMEKSLLERGGGSWSSYSLPSRARHTPKTSFLSVHGHSPIRPAAAEAAAGSPPTDSVADEAVSCETLSAGSQHSAHIFLSLLTQARIPS